jgi:hypothetical protein
MSDSEDNAAKILIDFDDLNFGIDTYLDCLDISYIINKYNTHKLDEYESYLINQYYHYIDLCLETKLKSQEILEYHSHQFYMDSTKFKRFIYTYVPGSIIDDDGYKYDECIDYESLYTELESAHSTHSAPFLTLKSINNVIFNLKKKRKELNK